MIPLQRRALILRRSRRRFGLLVFGALLLVCRFLPEACLAGPMCFVVARLCPASRICSASNLSCWAEGTDITDERQLLPAPGNATSSEDNVTTIEIGGETVKMDKLGPFVVNTDGTIGRISNWHEMTTVEQETTLKLVVRRNRKRMAALREEGQETGRPIST
mmetsp:Transcript_67507/g.149578  ORF Transcript_67507/g.149578 Transcript_67507/m.149578 type:complete len:162 (+) Transcript_67507:61-546(+)